MVPNPSVFDGQHTAFFVLHLIAKRWWTSCCPTGFMNSFTLSIRWIPYCCRDYCRMARDRAFFLLLFLFVSQKSIGLSTFSFGRCKDVTINILNTSKWCMIKTIVYYSRRYNERSDTCIGTHNAHITRHYFIVQGFSMYNVMETYDRAIYQLAKWRWIVSLYLLLAQD